MERLLWHLTIFIYSCILVLSSSQTHLVLKSGASNKTNFLQISKESKSRNKRYLIFENGGVLKLVLGFSQPMDLLDKYPHRQLSVSYSFHLQYTPPPVPIYWWSYFVNNTSWADANNRQGQRSPRQSGVHKRNYHHNPHLNHYGTFVQNPYRKPAIVYDASRAFVYKAIETVFNSKGLPGERCLQRAICEISQRPLHEDRAINRIINAVFSPSVPNIDGKYLRAKQISDYGLDCEKVYWSCNEGIKWLKKTFFGET